MITHLEVNTVNQFSQYQLVMSNFPFQHGRFSLQWLHSQASWAGCVKSQLGWAAIGSLQLKSILFLVARIKICKSQIFRILFAICVNPIYKYLQIFKEQLCQKIFEIHQCLNSRSRSSLNAWDIGQTWFDQFVSLRAVAAQPCRRWKIFHKIP